MGNLFIDGQRKPSGVYGSSLSTAPLENQDDDIFSGLGTITVAGVALSSLEITGIEVTDGVVTLTWVSNPNDFYSVFYSNDLLDFSLEVTDDVEAEEVGNRTSFDFPVTLIGGLDKAFFIVRRN